MGRTVETRSWDATNGDLLFELTSTLAIARAATSSTFAATSTKWALVPTTGDETAFQVESNALICRLSKGRPKDPNGNDLLSGADVGDKLSQLIVATGNNATGGQPDIVLTFWRPNAKATCVTYLADAKRNREGTGKTYLSHSIAKALVYRYAYEPAFGANRNGEQVGETTAPPYVTLFCFQACNMVANVETQIGQRSDWQAKLANALIDSQTVIGDVLAFDLRHFGLEEVGAAWDGTILRAWFDRLACQADEAIKSAATL